MSIIYNYYKFYYCVFIVYMDTYPEEVLLLLLLLCLLLLHTCRDDNRSGTTY